MVITLKNGYLAILNNNSIIIIPIFDIFLACVLSCDRVVAVCVCLFVSASWWPALTSAPV